MTRRLRELQGVAKKLGHEDVYAELVEPWLEHGAGDLSEQAAPQPPPTAATVVALPVDQELTGTLKNINATLADLSSCMKGCQCQIARAAAVGGESSGGEAQQSPDVEEGVESTPVVATAAPRQLEDLF